VSETECIKLAHGGGGQLTRELVERLILPALGGPQKAGRLSDAALIDVDAGRIAFTTDSYVVQPLEFPGGDIGKLAVCGTVNDLAVCGARPAALSMALVLEEGLATVLLRRVLESAGRAASDAGVAVVTGDTKVVRRGEVDGMVVNTAGVGIVPAGRELGFDRIAAGDRVVLSGPLGLHAMAVMSCREGLSFSAELVSDCGPVAEMAEALLSKLGGAVRFMRDPTRGGAAATIVEIANATGRDVELRQADIPVHKAARAAAEMLGIDLLTAANEGRLIAVVAEEAAADAIRILEECKQADRPAVIGKVGRQSDNPLVEMVTAIGGRRIVQMPYGEELPRIC
jgi:hydrogenase expression/formation protein HypE